MPANRFKNWPADANPEILLHSCDVCVYTGQKSGAAPALAV